MTVRPAAKQTGKRDQERFLAAHAGTLDETSVQIPTAQVVPKRTPDVTRQADLSRIHLLEEAIQVLLHRLVQRGLSWAPGPIDRR